MLREAARPQTSDAILGIDDLVTFEGANVDELERAFHEAVDDYLALCEKLGRTRSRLESRSRPGF